jgi:hypothetical protein
LSQSFTYIGSTVYDEGRTCWADPDGTSYMAGETAVPTGQPSTPRSRLTSGTLANLGRMIPKEPVPVSAWLSRCEALLHRARLDRAAGEPCARDLDEVIQNVETVLRGSPKVARLYLRRGQARRLQGDPAAEADFARALELDPSLQEEARREREDR